MKYNGPEMIDTRPEDILQVLGKPHVLDILDVTAASAHTVREICRSRDLPKTTVYRRIDELADVGILREQMQPSRNGHHTHLYENNLDRLEIRQLSDDTTFKVDVEVAESPADRLAEATHRLRE